MAKTLNDVIKDIDAAIEHFSKRETLASGVVGSMMNSENEGIVKGLKIAKEILLERMMKR